MRRPRLRELPACGPATDGDCCRPAVQRAYRELLAKGEPDRYCFEAALTVYRWHHPETPAAAASGIVTAWVAAADTMH